ncbi:hypothetical protein Unana1_04324 [Umbelopsis nana]
MSLFMYFFGSILLSGLLAVSGKQQAVNGLYSPQDGGKVAPLLPQEYAFSFVQHKWNQNGFGVNHVGTGVWISSMKEQKVRVDIASSDWLSNNATQRGPLVAGPNTSLFDFATTAKTGNVSNTYISYQGTQATCNQAEIPLASSQGQLFPPSYIRDNGVYFGNEITQGIGAALEADKWVVFIGTTVVTFYFDSNGNWISYDEVSPGLQTSVVTLLYNLDTEATFDKSVFQISCAK